MGERDRVEGEVPCGEPRVLPRIRHGQHIRRVEVAPAGVATMQSLRWRRRTGRVAVQPARDAVQVGLLAPQHAGEGLAHDQGFLVARARSAQGGVELVGLALTLDHHRRERVAEGIGIRRSELRGCRCHRAISTQTQADLGAAAGGDRQPVPRRCLGPCPGRIDGRGAGHDVVVDTVLGKRRAVRRSVEASRVGVVVAEQELWSSPVGRIAYVQGVGTQVRMGREDRPTVGRGAQVRPHAIAIPRPGVATPQGGQHVEGRPRWAGVAYDYPHQDVVRLILCVVDLHDPVAVVIEDTRVDQFVLGLGARAAGILRDQLLVREATLGVVVAPAQPGGAGQGVQVPPALLDILAVVALAVGQPEHPLLEDRVLAIPQGERQAHPGQHVGDAGHAVLATPKGT